MRDCLHVDSGADLSDDDMTYLMLINCNKQGGTNPMLSWESVELLPRTIPLLFLILCSAQLWR